MENGSATLGAGFGRVDRYYFEDETTFDRADDVVGMYVTFKGI